MRARVSHRVCVISMLKLVCWLGDRALLLLFLVELIFKTAKKRLSVWSSYFLWSWRKMSSWWWLSRNVLALFSSKRKLSWKQKKIKIKIKIKIPLHRQPYIVPSLPWNYLITNTSYFDVPTCSRSGGSISGYTERRGYVVDIPYSVFSGNCIVINGNGLSLTNAYLDVYGFLVIINKETHTFCCFFEKICFALNEQ